MIVPLRVALMGVVFGLIAGCGGGGGGGGGGSGSDDGGPAAATGVRILHAAIDAPPVEVVSSSSEGVIDSARFAESSAYGGLATGAQNLLVRPRLEAARTLGAFDVVVAQGERRSLLLFGEEETGLQSALLLDTPGEIPGGKGVVRVVNGVASSSAIAVTITGAETGVDLPRGAASSYQPITAGPQTITVRSGERTVFSGARVFEAGKPYSVLVAGEAGYFVTVTLLND
jgi:hypothetical protein